MKAVNTDKAPKAIGPYSQAAVIGNMVYTAGQIPIDPSSGNVKSTAVDDQTRQVLENLAAVLEKAGSGLDKVIKTTVYIRNMGSFNEMNSVYAEYFSEPWPARSCVEVSRLPKDVMVEIDAIGYIED